MKDEVKRCYFAIQLPSLFARDDHRIRFDSETVVRCERHRGVTASENMTILEGIVLFVIAMGQPFWIGDDSGGIWLHSMTLPFTSGAGKQPRCRNRKLPPPTVLG